MKKLQGFGRRLFLELLEDRQMLSVYGPPPVTLVSPIETVVEQAMPVQTIYPLAQNAVLGRWNISTTKGYGRVWEIFVIPSAGSDRLSYDTTQLMLLADMNNNLRDGPNKDGYETAISYATADPTTDVVDFVVNQPVWTRPDSVLRIAVVANFGTWPMGTAVGVEIAHVNFGDLLNNSVPNENVRFSGRTVLHNVATSMFGVSWQQMDVARCALFGQKSVELGEFNSWTRDSLPGTVSFTAQQGNLRDATNYKLKADYDWDGIIDEIIPGVVTSGIFKNQLVFNLGNKDAQGGNYKIFADIVEKPVSGHLQLAFVPGGVAAKNAKTGRPLQGVVQSGWTANGKGGQIQVWEYYPVTTVTFVKTTEVVVKEVVGLPGQTSVGSNANLTVEAFTAYSASNFTLTHVGIATVEGNFASFTNYVLWEDVDGDGGVDTVVGTGTLLGTQIVFDNLTLSLTGGTTTKFEVRADVADTSASYFFRTALAGDNAITAKRPTGDLVPLNSAFIGYSRQTQWMFGEGGLG